jgi:hypothetical protein
LGKVEKGLAKLHSAAGRCESFSAYLLRIATIMGCTEAREHDDQPLSLTEMVNRVNVWERDWIAAGKETA